MNIPRSHAPLNLLPPPHKPLYPNVNTMLAPMISESSRFIPAVSPRSAAGRMDIDEDYDAGSDKSENEKMAGGVAARKKSSRGFTNTKAAYVLMRLKTQTDLSKTDVKSLKRRASA